MFPVSLCCSTQCIKKKIPTRRAQETGKIVVLLVSCLEKNRVLTISVALGVKVGFVAGDTAPIQGPPSQLLRAGLCFDRRAECNADSCFNFQPDADITHTEPKTQEREPGHWAALRPRRAGWRGRRKPTACLRSPISWRAESQAQERHTSRRVTGRLLPDRCFYRNPRPWGRGQELFLKVMWHHSLVVKAGCYLFTVQVIQGRNHK